MRLLMQLNGRGFRASEPQLKEQAVFMKSKLYIYLL